jgi:tRNA(Ile)-lysidine synthase
VLLTAHHANDQAETLLMRAARGSGLQGLAGIRPAVDLSGVRVIRPLLHVPRAELAAIVADFGWQPVDDPSNRDPRFDRTAARGLFAAADWLNPVRLAATAAHLAAAEEALAWATDTAWRSRVVHADGEVRIDTEGLPADIQRRLLVAAAAVFAANPADGSGVERLRLRLSAGRGGTLAGVRARALGHGLWLLAPAPPRRASRRRLEEARDRGHHVPTGQVAVALDGVAVCHAGDEVADDPLRPGCLPGRGSGI